MKKILIIALCSVMALGASAQSTALTYNCQTASVKDTTSYVTVSATTYAGALAYTNVEGYLLAYSDTTINVATAGTTITSPKTLTLSSGGVLNQLPTSSFFSASTIFKFDTTYTFTYLGQRDSVRFHRNAKYNIVGRGIVVNTDDVVTDNHYHVYPHVYHAGSPPVLPSR